MSFFLVLINFGVKYSRYMIRKYMEIDPNMFGSFVPMTLNSRDSSLSIRRKICSVRYSPINTSRYAKKFRMTRRSSMKRSKSMKYSRNMPA